MDEKCQSGSARTVDTSAARVCVKCSVQRMQMPTNVGCSVQRMQMRGANADAQPTWIVFRSAVANGIHVATWCTQPPLDELANGTGRVRRFAALHLIRTSHARARTHTHTHVSRDTVTWGGPQNPEMR